MGAKRERTSTNQKPPKSIRHKQILDVAEDQPEASIEDIAEEVVSATPDLVERILNEYGDPGGPSQNESASNQKEQGEVASPSLDELTDGQRNTLRAIYNHPEATQRELAEILDVSGSTISNRANSIEGFEWENRRAIAEAVFTDLETDLDREIPDMTSNNRNGSKSIDRLQDRIAKIEQRIDQLTTTSETSSALDEPELVHKVLHACLESDTITEEEELQLLKSLLQSPQ